MKKTIVLILLAAFAGLGRKFFATTWGFNVSFSAHLLPLEFIGGPSVIRTAADHHSGCLI